MFFLFVCLFNICIIGWVLNPTLNYPFIVSALAFKNKPTILNVSFLAMLIESIQRLLHIIAAQRQSIKTLHVV